MKKLSAAILVAVLLVSVLSVIQVNAADDFTYAHIVASGTDPYATFNFNPNGNHTTIDPDTVKWASIKYRTVTETDNTGVQLTGQLYINPAVEPFIPIKYNHTKQWETLVIDLTSVSEKTSLSSAWNSSKYTAVEGIRFDPLEPDRDAEAQDTEHDTAVVSDGDSIDIAYIAFFESEEDAKNYDGTQDTPYCIILPEDLEWYSSDNSIGSVDIYEPKKPAQTTAEATKEETKEETQTTAEETKEETKEESQTTAEATKEETKADTQDDIALSTDAATKAADTAATTDAQPSGGSGFPVWGIVVIAVAAVVLVAAIIALAVKKKK